MKRYEVVLGPIPSTVQVTDDGPFVSYEEAQQAIKLAVENARKEERNRIISVVESRLKLSRLSSGEVSRGWQLAIDNVNATIRALEDGE